jgi:hypothetical protein
LLKRTGNRKGIFPERFRRCGSRAVEQSVNRVEVLRKQRKEAKKKAEAKANHDAKIFHEVNRALKTDIWQRMFHLITLIFNK